MLSAYICYVHLRSYIVLDIHVRTSEIIVFDDVIKTNRHICYVHLRSYIVLDIHVRTSEIIVFDDAIKTNRHNANSMHEEF